MPVEQHSSLGTLAATCDLIVGALDADYVGIFAEPAGSGVVLQCGSTNIGRYKAESAQAGARTSSYLAGTDFVPHDFCHINDEQRPAQDIICFPKCTVDGSGGFAIAVRFRRKFGRGEQLLARRIAEPLRVQLQQFVAAQHDRVQPAWLDAVLEVMSDAIAVLDENGAVIATNASANRLLAGGDGLRMFGTRISAVTLDDAVRLQTAIEFTLRPGSASSEQTQPAIVSIRRKAGRPLTVAVLRLAGLGSHAGAGVVLRIVDPTVDIHAEIASVCSLYELTGAECRLAQALVTGVSLAEAAAQLRIQLPTARGYLQQIFAKTGTNRQAALVHLMMSSLVQLPRHRQAG